MKQEQVYDIIISQIITEKAVSASEHGKVYFKVCPDATKSQVKKAVETLFKVKPKKISVINTKPKVKKFKGVSGKTKPYKKVVVSLNKGDSIEINNGI